MKIIVGSYATADRPLRGSVEFEVLSTGVLALDHVDGLELPFLTGDSPWPHEHASSTGAWRVAGWHALTTLPAVMARREVDPAFGLASTDGESRRAAVDLIRRSCTFVAGVNAGQSARVDTVQLHSAPGSSLSSADGLARSLDEIITWDWAGAALAIEHCDAYEPRRNPAKGFLTLREELRIAADRGIGTVINWGRSAIETRGADGPVAHLEATLAAGTLTGLIFSGCTNGPSPYGPPFSDRHVPVRDWGSGVLSDAAAASLLTADEMRRCVGLASRAPGLRYFGVKVKAPRDAQPLEWLDVIDGSLRPLRESLHLVTRGD